MISVQPQPQPKMNRQNESEFFERILSSVNASIYILNLDPFRVEWINDSLHTLRGAGMAADEIINGGDDVVNRLIETSDFRESVVEATQFFYQNPHKTWQGIFRTHQPKNTARWILATAVVLEKNKAGIPQKTLATAMDITELIHTNDSMAATLQVMQQNRHKNTLDLLTKREKEIIRLLAGGMSTKEIADKLKRSFHTIETHRGNIKNKLNCKNVAEIAAIGQRIGLV